ncbi:hypothetical protein [uncultured Bacteroides sp.]|uniref:hypothetical protein n=1 Tax=uncultured Bacteroides sp. TaxID=162156 RepID=UPI0025DD6CAF|nr:hypothetical protein [uncultured Bacteroides sp.]
MKKILTLLLCVLTYSTLSAQTSTEKRTTFQLTFFPPLSTNGMYSHQYTNTISINLLAGISQNEEAFTWGGLANVVLNDAKGFQMAGLANYVGNDGQGFQNAGLANINKNRFSGFQMAGLVNTASEMKGFQFSGLANIASDVNGVQFAGLINIAKDVHGVQFAGLINIAENSDCPIGLINIIKNGEKGIAVTYDAIGSTVVSFRSGGKYTYGILGVGYNHKSSNNSLVTEGGLGAHIPVTPWFRINNELKGTSIGNNTDEPVFNAGYSLLPAFRIGKHVELFAGAGINYMDTKDMNNLKMFPNHSLWKKSGSSRMQQLYIGYQFGLQYIF